MRISNWVQKLLIFLLVIIALKFFEARFLGDLIGSKIPTLILICLITYSLTYFFKFNSEFVLPIQLLTFSSLFSIILAFLYWNQSLSDSLVRTIPIAVFPIFFLLKNFKISIQQIEKTILFLGFIYIILYTYQYVNPSTVFFGKAGLNEFGEYEEKRGVIRIIFPGSGIFWMAVFISISKITQKKNIVFFFFTIMGLIVPVMQAIRQLIAIILLLYSFHFGKYLSLWKKLTFFGIFSLGIFLFLNSDFTVIEGLKDTTEKDKNEGTKYIRLITAEYYFLEFSNNLATIIFGNGVPNERSRYGQITSRLTDKEIWLEDVGIAGLYSQFGLLSVIAWLIIAYKSLVLKVPKNYIYCKYYLWLILITSFTSGSIYNIHYAISTVLVLYIFDSITDKKYHTIKEALRLYLKKKNSQPIHS